MILEKTRNYWDCFPVPGVTMVALGSITLAMVPLLQEEIFIVIGAILLAAGILQLMQALVTQTGETALNGVTGLLYGYAGYLLITNPVDTISALSHLFGVLFFAWGAVKIVSASRTREYPARSYLGINAFVSIVFGLFLITQWPCTASSLIGTFVAIDLITDGIAWIAVVWQKGKRLPSYKLESQPSRVNAA